jgi:RNA polymerase sigma-70 factor (ECF subfamily)
MSLTESTLAERPGEPEACPVGAAESCDFPPLTMQQERRLAEMLTAHFAVVWRAGRRAGLLNGQAEEIAQEAFALAARRLDSIELGRERAYLIAVASRLAQNARRRLAARCEWLAIDPEHHDAVDLEPHIDDLVARKQGRELLDSILASMSDAFREVLTLYEIHDFTLQEIAVALGIPEGTAASRLRRAREEFTRKVERFTMQTASRKERT